LRDTRLARATPQPPPIHEEQERSAYQQYRQQVKAEARFTFADLLAKKGPSQH